MKKNIYLAFLVLVTITTNAQLQADFYCSGCGFDACATSWTDVSIQGNNPIVAWYWDFGNGITSTYQNPSCTPCYEDTMGSFTVCLTVYDANGYSSQKCKQNYIIHDAQGVRCNYFVGIFEDQLSGVTFSNNLLKFLLNVSNCCFHNLTYD